MYYTVAICRP